MSKNNNTWGIASLVTSIFSLLCVMMPYFGLPLAIFALYAAAKQNKISESGQATAGNVIGILSVIVNSIMLLIAIIGIMLMGIVQ